MHSCIPRYSANVCLSRPDTACLHVGIKNGISIRLQKCLSSLHLRHLPTIPTSRNHSTLPGYQVCKFQSRKFHPFIHSVVLFPLLQLPSFLGERYERYLRRVCQVVCALLLR